MGQLHVAAEHIARVAPEADWALVSDANRYRRPPPRRPLTDRARLLSSQGKEKQVENNNEFWANVSAVAISPVAVAAGIAKGAYDASTDNGPFSDGFEATAIPIMRAAKEFGAEHGTIITKGVITGAAGALGARIVREALKHLRI
jgi:hypothetical protein